MPKTYENLEWYGHQTLGADAVAFLLMLAAVPAESAPAGVLGFATLILGAPAVHFGRDQYGTAGWSLLLRTVWPIGLGLVAAAVEDCPGAAGRQGVSLCGVDGFVLGYGVGIVTAVVVDASVLAFDKHEMIGSPPPNFGGLRLMPQIDRSGALTGLSLGGQF